MNAKLLIAFSLVFFPTHQDNCGRCDCSDYPLTEDFCIKCCFTEKGTVTSATPNSVTVTPARSLDQPKPTPKKFRIGPRTKLAKPLESGRDATVYYHKVDGEDFASRIDLTDYEEGQLVPDSLPTPPDNACANPPPFPVPVALPKEATMILFGVSGTIATSYPFVALRIDEEDIITVQKTEKGMLVSAKLYDSQGKLAALIIDNRFFVKARPALQLDDSDPHTLRIAEATSTLVDIQFMNPRVMRVLGTLYGPLGTHLDVSQNEMTVNRSRFVSICAAGGGVGISIH